MKITKTLYVSNRDDWRAWLAENHATETEVWLIYYKKESGRPRIPYDDSVEEALCFGWIDSTVQRIDEEKYAQKFTPRRSNSKWSDSNRRRVARLIKEGKMTGAGLAKIPAAVLAGEEASKPARPKEEPAVPDYLQQALMASPAAWENFNNLAPSYRRNYIHWITAAKQEATRGRRLKEAIELLERNEKLGMK